VCVREINASPNNSYLESKPDLDSIGMGDFTHFLLYNYTVSYNFNLTHLFPCNYIRCVCLNLEVM
jgi:hypothetical protein